MASRKYGIGDENLELMGGIFRAHVWGGVTPAPAPVQQEVERTLSGAARRLLAAEVDADAVEPAARPHVHAIDHGADDPSALVG